MTTASSSSFHRQPRRRGLLRVGVITGLIALAALAVGGGIIALDAMHRDDDGFYTTDATPVTTPTYALVSDGLEIGNDVPDWLFRKGRLGTIRVTATGTDAQPVFVGLARAPEVARYLERVEREEITDMDVHPFSLTSVRRPGGTPPGPPTEQRFWAKSVNASGTTTLEWPLREGDWAIVVMNADGSRGVRTSLGVGANVPAVRALGLSLLVLGTVLALGAAAAAAAGVHPRRNGPARTTRTHTTRIRVGR